MKRIMNISATFVIVSAVLINGCGNNQKPATVEKLEPAASQEPTEGDLIKRGEYFVTMAGCNDCHSPKNMTPNGPVVISDRMLSGHPSGEVLPKIDPALLKKGLMVANGSLTAFAGMWGISYSANITSDQTGIGNWTEENFKRALKEGKFKGLEGSRTLLPPMPWQNFATITDEDVRAVYAYLKSTKPVNNVVPLPVPPENIK